MAPHVVEGVEVGCFPDLYAALAGKVDQAHGEVGGLQELEEGEVIGAGWFHRDGLGMVEAEGSQQSLPAFRGVGEAEVSLVAWAEEGQVQVTSMPARSMVLLPWID